MMSSDFFQRRPDLSPKIYAYVDTNPQYNGLLKVGYTTDNVLKRVGAQYPTKRPGPSPFKIVLEEPAMRSDGTTFTDHEVHRVLRRMGKDNPVGEWFKCTTDDIKAAIIAIRNRDYDVEPRTLDFKMRPEQEEAVRRTAAYFREMSRSNAGRTPSFLWNAKMRFGKTFAAYQLAREMGWKKLLVLTFKPAVQSAWESDLKHHVDFKGWQFLSANGLSFDQLDRAKPIVCFGSFQDYLGKNKSSGGIKTKNEWVHATNWDCVILDEYHFGAWRDSAKELFEAEDSQEISYALDEGLDYFDQEIMPITTYAYLYLSGTPFRAISTGEFIEEQIFNWTYSDEQRAKLEWKGADNPYAALPRMVLMTYQLPDSIREIAKKGQYDEFDLNEFFSASGIGDNARFKYQDDVQKWLNLIRGEHIETSLNNIAINPQKPPLPFCDGRLLNILSHTFWFMPNIASCYAMRNLLRMRQNKFYHDYKVIVAAGVEAGIGVDALKPVYKAMDDPLSTKTITLSCGKLTTGVTVKPWTGILMLRNLTSPETYFQAAFRVQSPWTVCENDARQTMETIIKTECYIFDFAPNRALRQIADYSCRLNINEKIPERKVQEFISFLPVLAYDGSSMRQIDALGVLDMAMSGTTATLLARRWESALLVNVDNTVLKRLIENDELMEALKSIEGFRNLNQNIETIINKSDAIKNIKREANDKTLDKEAKKELTKEEKELKSLRKEIQENLIKFATRIPIFMYLTDFRERCLYDVITQLEPGLFKKVTNLDLKDFDRLISIGIFNGPLMNDAIFKFRRYEESSLSYTGIYKHKEHDIGMFYGTMRREDYNRIIEGQ